MFADFVQDVDVVACQRVLAAVRVYEDLRPSGRSQQRCPSAVHRITSSIVYWVALRIDRLHVANAHGAARQVGVLLIREVQLRHASLLLSAAFEGLLLRPVVGGDHLLELSLVPGLLGSADPIR